MIQHCVFCQIDPAANRGDLARVMRGLSDLCGALEGAISFKAGPNRDFEHKSAPFTDGFVVEFADRAALDVYANHPEHKRLGAALCDLCLHGADGITVFDLETP